MDWIALNLVPLTNIIGIFFDIIGAFLVATEVINKFHGRQYGGSMMFDSSFMPPPPLTAEYKKWALLKERKMTIGLFCLTLGFCLQIIANVLQFNTAS